MEHREMRRHAVALRRIVPETQVVEPGEVFGRKLRRDDQRRRPLVLLDLQQARSKRSTLDTSLSVSALALFQGRRRRVSPTPAIPPCDATT